MLRVKWKMNICILLRRGKSSFLANAFYFPCDTFVEYYLQFLFVMLGLWSRVLRHDGLFISVYFLNFFLSVFCSD